MQKKVRYLGLATAMLGVFGCASTDRNSTELDPTPLDTVIENTLAQSELGRTSGYYATVAHHWMTKRLPERGGCYRIGEPSKMYLRIEADATVSGVYGDPENNRSQCFRLSYTGVRVPKPPAAPFYMSLDIQ